MSNDRPTVLFVDDEPSVLRGIRLSLRAERHNYEFLWAQSTSEALEVVASNDVDVVFTDMRMPGGNGADLLVRLKEEQPSIVRYVLSGEAGSALVMQTMLVAHRWLTKPCDRSLLLEALHDATRYRRLLCGSDLGDAVTGMTSLPALPDKYIRLQQLLADPDVSLDQVAELVETDPAISAKLLQLANSAYAGGVPSRSVRDAIGRIGLLTVSQLALSVEVLRTLEPRRSLTGLPGCALDHYGERLGDIARRVTVRDQASLAGVAGLLSSIGILVQASDFPDRLRNSHQAALDRGVSLDVAELELYGSTHADLAGYLLSIWGLPADIVLAVAASTGLPDLDADPPFDLTASLQVARLLVCHPDGHDTGCLPAGPLDPSLETALTRWSRWLEEQAREEQDVA